MRKHLLTLACAALLGAPASAVTFDWVTVGDPGNAADTEVMQDGTTGYGSVPYTYRISATEVTNAQYAEFLNAVAATDTGDLYDWRMTATWRGGITRSGSPGSYTYSTIAGRENMPVHYVDFYDSLRFANWLHNGQPTGAQGTGTTEDGAYDMSLGSNVTRNPWAKIFVPSEDEWYKAAYYDAVSMRYFDFPARTDVRIVCALAGATENTANCNLVESALTNVGSYTGSSSPSGTFDQGGNVREWNEALIGTRRGVRGGSFNHSWYNLAAWRRGSAPPGYEMFVGGLRVASLPEPSVDCSSAAAVPDGIWPPNHKFHDVSVAGVTSTTGDPVTITITGVAQDEPLEGAGNDSRCPDGDGIGTDTASVRAERSGPGDGRVYHISFSADDGQFGECTGTVTVCVPHDEGQGGACMDGGPIFDSTVCEGDLAAAAASAAAFGRSCGLGGFELALILPGLMWLHRRRRP